VIEVLGHVDPLLLAAVTAWCAQRDVLATSLSIESRTLEDVFLELTGKDLRRERGRPGPPSGPAGPGPKGLPGGVRGGRFPP